MGQLIPEQEQSGGNSFVSKCNQQIWDVFDVLSTT
jgi:hypothetical protein